MRAVLVLAVLAGCHGAEQFDCVASMQCRLGADLGTCEPTGFCSFIDPSCDSGRRYDPSAGADKSGTELGGECVGGSDGDHDGVADADDNCPTTFNPTQANKDGDRFGDACDPCPPIADADPAVDSDNDGVSDNCDPHTDLAKPDHIVLFEGFYNGMPASWTRTGSWATSPGEINFVGAANFTLAIPSSSGETYLYTGLELQTIAASDIEVGLALAGMTCKLEKSGTSQLALRTDTNALLDSIAYTLVAPRSYVLIAWWDGAVSHGCYLDDHLGPAYAVSGTHASTAQNLGFASSGAVTGALTYLMVVAQ